MTYENSPRRQFQNWVSIPGLILTSECGFYHHQLPLYDFPTETLQWGMIYIGSPERQVERGAQSLGNASPGHNGRKDGVSSVDLNPVCEMS